ncbi:MAG TPA: ABC transporter substrate-binding protein [Usitatibacter sp.]|nr:ABC transporter substrate-binding protein [Usitatibacter sp.]
MVGRALRIALTAAIVAFGAAPVAAKTLRWSATGDASTQDPHAEAELFTQIANQQVYDALVRYDTKLGLSPSLATEWKATGPRTWVFRLRRGVKFSDGTPFTADDVVFSYERASSSGSTYKLYARQAGKPRRIDDYTVEFTNDAPNPVEPATVTNIFIMSRAWCEKHRTTKPQDYAHDEETYSARHAMGTGPYKLVSYEPGVKSIYEKNPDWWGIRAGLFTGNADRVVYRPIVSPATRMAALRSGEIDFVLDPPVQDVPRLMRDPSMRVLTGDENRVIFIGLDEWRDQLLYSDVKGRNPFRDRRVRLALYQAIDIEALKKSVMRGLSTPTGIPLPTLANLPGVKDERYPFDLAASRKLLADAGYPKGFAFTLHCPNDRYVNDEKICIALAGMWAKAGVRVNVDSAPKTLFFQRCERLDVSAYLVGWGGAATDPIFTLKPILHSRTKEGAGDSNFGDFRIPELDALTDRIESEMDPAKREEMVRQAVAILKREIPVLPLHRQVIPWVMRAGVEVTHRANNTPLIYTVRMP